MMLLGMVMWMFGLIYGSYLAHTAGEAIMEKRYDVACVRAYFALSMFSVASLSWYKFIFN